MINSISDQKDILWLYFISSTSLVMSITALLFRWREKPMISFSRNFQTNNFNEIFRFLILLCSTLCGSLKVYMVVNFRARKNNQDSRKLPEYLR